MKWKRKKQRSVLIIGKMQCRVEDDGSFSIIKPNGQCVHDKLPSVEEAKERCEETVMAQERIDSLQMEIRQIVIKKGKTLEKSRKFYSFARALKMYSKMPAFIRPAALAAIKDLEFRETFASFVSDEEAMQAVREITEERLAEVLADSFARSNEEE